MTGANAVTNAWKINTGSAAYFGGDNAIQLAASTTLPPQNTEYIHIANPGLTVTLSGYITGNSILDRAADAAGQTNGTFVINNPLNNFSGNFTWRASSGNVDVQGTARPAHRRVRAGSLGTERSPRHHEPGFIGLLNSSSVAVTLANALNINDGRSYVSVSGMKFTGPVTVSRTRSGTTNNGVIEIYLGANNNVAFTGQISNGPGERHQSPPGLRRGRFDAQRLEQLFGPDLDHHGHADRRGNAPNSLPGVFGNAAGAITIGDANSGGNPAALVTNGAYTIGRAITVNANAGPTTLGGIAGRRFRLRGAITLSGTSNGVTLSAAAGGSVSFTGPISGASAAASPRPPPGNGNVVASAPANANSYTGATTVSSGQLTLDLRPFDSLGRHGGRNRSRRLARHAQRRHVGLQRQCLRRGQPGAWCPRQSPTSVRRWSSTQQRPAGAGRFGPITRSGGVLRPAHQRRPSPPRTPIPTASWAAT